MPLRPILKSLPLSDPSFVSSEAASNPLPFSSCSTMLDSPHVHFPPTPTLTSTEITHSSFIYDRAPIVVTPNTCALPERGSRKFIGTNSNKAGLGYFHPHAKFQVDTARVERNSSETTSPTIFSASVTVGNVNDRGSVELFMAKRSGPLYEYEYDLSDQRPSYDQHAQHVMSPIIFDPSSKSSDLGVLRPPLLPYVSLSPTSPSSIPHPSVNLSTRNMYNTSTTPTPSPSSTVNNMAENFDNNESYPNQFISHTHIEVQDTPGYPSTLKQFKRLDVAIPFFLPPSTSESPIDKCRDKKRVLIHANGKRRRKTHNRAEGDRTRIGTSMFKRQKDSDSDDCSREFELEGCLGGF